MNDELKRATAKTLSKLVKYHMSKEGLTQAGMAKKTGLSQRTIGNVLMGRGNVTMKTVEALMEGIGAPLQKDIIKVSAESETIVSQNVVLIPRLDISASMGDGALNPEYDTVVDHLRLSADWARKNLSVSNPQNLKALSAYGDSMIPTFSDGDILIVDTGVTEVKLDAVYVLRWDDELFVKRIQRHPETNSLSIISDNTEVYKPKEVPRNENGFEVLGRVVWAWNGKKL